MGYSASRSSNVLPPSPSERAPAPTLCSLGAPKLRNLLAALCFYLSAFVTRLSVATNCPDYYVTRISLQLLPKTVQVTSFSLLLFCLLPDFHCCPGQPQNLPSLPDPLSCLLLNFTSFSLLVCPCYQTSVAVPDSPESALVTRFSLGLLQTVHVTSFSPLLICPCYQIFAAVLDSPESVHVTRFSLVSY